MQCTDLCRDSLEKYGYHPDYIDEMVWQSLPDEDAARLEQFQEWVLTGVPIPDSYRLWFKRLLKRMPELYDAARNIARNAPIDWENASNEQRKEHSRWLRQQGLPSLERKGKKQPPLKVVRRNYDRAGKAHTTADTPYLKAMMDAENERIRLESWGEVSA